MKKLVLENGIENELTLYPNEDGQGVVISQDEMLNISKKYYKIYDVISIGTFAQYKRQHLITKFEGKKAVYGNKYGNDNNPIVKYLENHK